jgi:chromosome partitioning protein
MRTVVLTCQKGGVGKTTHTAHLAVALEAMGQGPVVVMDLDPQGTLSDWWNDRTAEVPAFAQVDNHSQLVDKKAQLEAAGYKWLVIDTPPQVAEINRSAIEIADLVIIPSKHSKGDIKATLPTVDMCEAAGTKFYYLLNETNGAGVTAAAVRQLAAIGPVIPQTIPKLNGYWQSMIEGKTLNEINKGTGALLINSLAEFVISKFEKPAKKEKAYV